MVRKQQIDEVKYRIGVGTTVAKELLVLSGGDVELVVDSSLKSPGLDQCKARIIDERFKRIENK